MEFITLTFHDFPMGVPRLNFLKEGWSATEFSFSLEQVQCRISLGQFGSERPLCRWGGREPRADGRTQEEPRTGERPGQPAGRVHSFHLQRAFSLPFT